MYSSWQQLPFRLENCQHNQYMILCILLTEREGEREREREGGGEGGREGGGERGREREREY